MKKIDLAKKNKCTGCLVCVDVCSKQAISVVMASDGHRYPKINTDICVGCGACIKKCPVTNSFNYASDFESRPFLAWANDDNLRLKSSSGGIFASLAYRVLQHKGYVVGCAMDGMQAKHIIIDSVGELPQLQGSKYLQSNTAGIYRQTKQILDNGSIVLFSGTRCQVAALLSYLPKFYHNLITVDLVCNGVPSNNLLKYYTDFRAIKSFRDKSQGWKHGYRLTLVNKSGDEISNYEDADMQENGFLQGLTNRYSCYNCLFAKMHSKSDITLMDFWGEKDYPQQHFKGVSCVIVNSNKGMDILQKSDMTLIESTWEKCLPYNPRIAIEYKPLFASSLERVLLSFAFNHFSKSTIKRIYVSTYRGYNPLWLFLRLVKKVRYTLFDLYLQREIKKILLNLK